MMGLLIPALIPASTSQFFADARTAMLANIADAAVRALLVAIVVGLALWALRARNVVTQKAAWVLVLAGAMAMPIAAPWAARWSWLPRQATVVLPVNAVRQTAVTPDVLPQRIAGLQAAPSLEVGTANAIAEPTRTNNAEDGA